MFKSRLNNYLLLFVSFLGFSCKSHAQVKWTTDSELKIYHGGGMNPESETVIIKSGKSSYIHWELQKHDTLYFKLSQPEIDALVKEMNNAGFSNMRSGSSGSIAYDAPTTSIEWKSGNKIQEISLGATTELKTGNAEKFYSLYNYIHQLALKKTNSARTP